MIQNQLRSHCIDKRMMDGLFSSLRQLHTLHFSITLSTVVQGTESGSSLAVQKTYAAQNDGSAVKRLQSAEE